MSCNPWRVSLRAAECYGLASLLVLVLLTIAGTSAAQDVEPTLKDVISGGKDDAKKPAPAPAAPAEPVPAAKPAAAAAAPAKDAVPEDQYNRGTPRRSMLGFLDASAKRDYERAAKYLDLRFLPPWYSEDDGPKFARKFRIALDRSPLWIDPDRLSDSPAGNPKTTDGLPVYSDRIGHIKTPDRDIEVTLDQITRSDGIKIWLLGSETVGDIPYLYDHFGFGVLDEIFPHWVFDYTVLGLGAWLWAGMLLVAAVAYLVALVLTRVSVFVLGLTRMRLTDRVENVIRGPIRLIFFIVIARGSIDLLGPSDELRAFMNAKTLPIIAVVWFVLRILDLSLDRVAQRLRRAGQSGAVVLLPPIANAFKGVLVTIGFMVWLDNIGFQISTLLAGLGIGGIAIALGLQKTIENMVGALTLYASQPVHVGDFCRFGNTLGNIEEIGLRATKVRTLDRTVVHVPNAEFVNLHLDNFEARDMIWFHPKIKLRYDTTPDQVRYIVVEVRRMLYGHPKVASEPQHVRFVGFAEHSLDLEVFAYVQETDYGVYLGIAEDLNLRIMDIITAAGTQLAIPAQATFVERGHGQDEGRVAETANQIQVWREQKSMYMPEFTKEKITELQDTIDFPDPGSPDARRA